MAGKRSNISRLAVKAMGLFGGVQVFGIVCSIVRTKLVALWIGAVGVALFGIFNQALELLNTATNLGIRQSSVRDISQAVAGRQAGHIARVVAAVRRWAWWLGLLGAALTAMLAPALSRVAFGDTGHVWGFVALSVAVLLMSLTSGEQAVLQGLTRLRKLATVTLWGNVGGLLISIPLFYCLRERSIVPSIVAYAASAAVAALVCRNRDYPAPRDLTARQTWAMGRGFVLLGIFMTAGSMVTSVTSFAFNAWLNHAGGTSQVGLYQAGFTLVNKYTGLVLTALGMEYYPRLARVAGSARRTQVMVSQEINVVMMVMAPVAVLFMLLRQPIVQLLYSSEFMAILTYVCWGMVGMVFRTLSWSLAFVMLARGDGKTYLITESADAVVSLALNIACYSLWGLNGLGVAFVLCYVSYTAMVAFVYLRVYRLRLIPSCLGNVAWTLAAAVATMACMQAGITWGAVALAAIVLTVAALQARRFLF